MPDFPEKVDRTSLNITEDKKEQLKQLFPEVFTEDKIDFDKLKTVLGDEIEDKKDRYEMTWAGKSNVFEQIRTPSTGTLRPDREESKNFNETDNIYIEGENLEVLKLLQKSYYGKIKMIYIDPPYNTGNDFVYNDDYKENLTDYLKMTGQIDEEGKSLSANRESSGRFHSDWMNMMYPRLFLARNLLREDGVIFISIDDNEVANLKKICDEIFGEKNFIANVIWERSFSPVNLKKHFSPNHEYILCYSKNIENTICNGLPRSDEANSRYKNPDNDPRGPWTSSDLSVGPRIKEKTYKIKTPSGKTVTPPKGRCWNVTKDKFEELVKDNRIWFGKDGSNVPRLKRFLSEVKDSVTPMTIWPYSDVCHTQEAKQNLKDLFDGNSVFDYPKPVALIQRMIQLYTNQNSIILDFFSGTAPTAHAVMKQNAQQEGNRKYIIVQMEEPISQDSDVYDSGYKNISEIGKERIRRAGDQIIEELKEENPSIFEENSDSKIDIGFKVFKLDRSNFKEWDSKPENVQLELEDHVTNIKGGRTKEEVLYEILLRTGMSLEEDIAEIELNDTKVYSIMDGVLLICLETDLDIELFREMAKRKPARVVCLDKSFHNNDQLKTNAAQIMKNTKYDGESSIEFKTI